MHNKRVRTWVRRNCTGRNLHPCPTNLSKQALRTCGARLLKAIAYGAIAALMVLNPLGEARADSPLTSTDLSRGYLNVSEVGIARQNQRVEGPVLTFLLGPASLDKKAAVVNALGWTLEGENPNSRLFLEGLAKSKRLTVEQLRPGDLSTSDRFVFGYLRAMGDYLNLSSPEGPPDAFTDEYGTPLQMLSQAANEKPGDFTIQFVRSLVQSQMNFSRSWCAIYVDTQNVLNRFPRIRRNMNAESVRAAVSYLEGYGLYCEPGA